MDSSLFDKYKDLKVVSDGTLFGISPLLAYTHKVCPYCMNQLYKMRNKKLMYCKSKKHKNKFIIKIK